MLEPVKVIWHDSVAYNDATEEEMIVKDSSILEVVSIGYLVKRTSAEVVIARDRHTKLHNVTMFDGYIAIPRGCIVKIIKLKNGGKDGSN